jgi:hypothetical protein
VAPWNGEFDPFSHPGAVVLRAAWDYHTAPDQYWNWLARLNPTRTFNPPMLVCWNLDKGPPSRAHGRSRSGRSGLGRGGSPDPRDDGCSHQANNRSQRLRGRACKTRGEAAALGRLLAVKSTEHLLVQEFVPEISAGELAGVFLDGVFSHGLRRVPARHEFRVNSQYEGRLEPATLTDDTIRQMAASWSSCLYRRSTRASTACSEPGASSSWRSRSTNPAWVSIWPRAQAERFAEALLARWSV